jgi:hypothetical protein
MDVAAAQAQAEHAAKGKSDARYARVSAAREAGRRCSGNKSSRRSSGRSSRMHTDVTARDRYVVC